MSRKPRIFVAGVTPSGYGGSTHRQLYDGYSFAKAWWTIKTKGRKFPRFDVVARESATETLHINIGAASPTEAVAALERACRRNSMAWTGR